MQPSVLPTLKTFTANERREYSLLSPAGYIERIDHLRFFAASLVVLFHTNLAMAGGHLKFDAFSIPIIDQGHIAVPLFMVISGLILAILCYDKEIDTLKFYWNRILRIYPLFIFILALGYFAAPASDPRPSSSVSNFLIALLPISNLARGEYGVFGGQLWSIAVELQFYLLFPMFHAMLRKHHFRYHVAVVLFLICIRISIFFLYRSVHHLTYFSIFGGLDAFLIGQIVGTMYAKRALNFSNPIWLFFSGVALNLMIWFVFRGRFFSHTSGWLRWPA